MTTAALPPPPTAPDIYHVYHLRYAHLATRRAQENFMLRDIHDGPMPIDYNVWIVRNAARTILVDTGFGARAAAERKRKLTIDPLEALERIGIPPATIGDVIITHLHYDHAGNVGRFDKARIHVQDAELTYATGRCMCDQYLRFPFDVEDIVAMIRHTYAERVTFHDGEAAPVPGITLHPLAGHSKGIQAVRVKTERGPVLLASDTTHYYANALRMMPFILTLDAVETMKTYRALMRLADGDVQRLVPGHDPKVRRYYRAITVNGVELQVLHEPPRPHTSEEAGCYDDYAGL